jgi:hypothetical protein
MSALEDVMCGSCPKQEECSGLDGLYQDENYEQLIKCLYLRKDAIRKGKVPSRLCIESNVFRCPACKALVDVRDDEEVDGDLKKNGDTATMACDCGKEFDLVIENGYITAKMRE